MTEKKQVLQILEISLIQRKATAMTLLGSGKLLITEKKHSFISDGQRKNVFCLWHNFCPCRRSGQSFLWISKLELTELSAVMPGAMRWVHPKGDCVWPKPCYLTHEETGEGTSEMPVERKKKGLPTPFLLQLWPVFIILCTFNLLHKL